MKVIVINTWSTGRSRERRKHFLFPSTVFRRDIADARRKMNDQNKTIIIITNVVVSYIIIRARACVYSVYVYTII